jgi:hypothetical protein
MKEIVVHFSIIFPFQCTESCSDCSKKIPKTDMELHRDLLCTGKRPITLTKKEVNSAL